jgi:toxin ParE1/3/4
MAEIKIVWTKLALSDLGQAYDYISSDRPGAARQIIERIEASVATISHHPEIGRPGRVSPTRELQVLGTPFLLVYRIRKGRLEILALIHGARRWPDSF